MALSSKQKKRKNQSKTNLVKQTGQTNQVNETRQVDKPIKNPNQTIENILACIPLFAIAFIYCFGIGNFLDTDMNNYLNNAHSMWNYQTEGVKGYPNQMFGFFFYWGYSLTGNSLGLSYILFLPLYLFGVYALFSIINFFTEQKYYSLFYSVIALIVNQVIAILTAPHIYVVYFFFFVIIIYLCLYHAKRLYLIGLFVGIAGLFRNQILTFLPFLPLIVNPKITKKDYLKSIIQLVSLTIAIQIAYEVIKYFTLIHEPSSANFSFYITEIQKNLLHLPSMAQINLFFTGIFTQSYYFYLLIAPCFFIFNKPFYNSIACKQKIYFKPFLYLALFIYFMPAIMYTKQGIELSSIHYFYLLRRYSFIMLILLIPIYHAILTNLTSVITKKNPRLQILTAFIILGCFYPILQYQRLNVVWKNFNNNFSVNIHKGIFGKKQKDFETIINYLFKENDYIVTNSDSIKLLKTKKYNYLVLPKKTFNHQVSLSKGSFSGIITLNSNVPFIQTANSLYKNIYTQSYDVNKTISIYKKVN